MAAFFSMGGYAIYVWPAYLAAALVLGVLTISSRRKFRKELAQLERLERQLESGNTRRPRPPAAPQ